jgi:hypothetical protein
MHSRLVATVMAAVKEHGSARTKRLLEARVRDADGFSRIKRYFLNGPQAEIVARRRCVKQQIQL